MFKFKDHVVFGIFVISTVVQQIMDIWPSGS